MFSSVLNIVLFLAMLGVLVTIHELGHFIAAKVFKVYVFEFAIGFGPKVFRKKKGETYYSLRALPLGGYVAMLGEEESIPDEFKDVQIDPTRSLLHINRGKRAVVMAAGVVMNLILGYTIFLISNGALMQNAVYANIQMSETSPLLDMGLEQNDYMVIQEVEVDDYNIQHFGIGTLSRDANATEFYVLFSYPSIDNLTFGGAGLQLLPVNTTTLTNDSFYTDLKESDVLVFEADFQRPEIDSEDNTVYVDLPGPYLLTFETVLKDANKPESGYIFEDLGFSFLKHSYRNNFTQTINAANKDFTDSLTAVGKGLKSLFTSGLANVSGPVGIFNLSASTLQNHGLGTFLYLWGLISVNLALFNLLPFPPLDGWHLLVVTIEAITRQEISPKFKQVASMIGAFLLIALTVAILAKDVISLFGVIL